MDYLDPEDRGSKLLQNIIKYSYLPTDMACFSEDYNFH